MRLLPGEHSYRIEDRGGNVYIAAAPVLSETFTPIEGPFDTREAAVEAFKSACMVRFEHWRIEDEATSCKTPNTHDMTAAALEGITTEEYLDRERGQS